jgi:hypothetical protein
MKSKKEGKIFKERKFLLKYGIWLGIVLLLFDFFGLFFIKSYSSLATISDYLTIFISVSVVLLSFFCYRHTSKKFTVEKKTLFILFIAFAFKLFGEILWAYYDLSGTIMPPFSLADLGWFMSNLAVMFGFAYKLRKTPMPHRKITAWVFTLVLFILSAFFMVGVYVKLLNLESGVWLSYLVNQSYVLFDFFVLILIVTPLYISVTKQNKSSGFYFFTALGFLTFIIYDFLFAETFLKGTYISGNKLDFVYVLGYFFLYCAFYFKYKFLEGFGKN